MKISIRILLCLLILHNSFYAFSADESQEGNPTMTCQEQDYIALRALFIFCSGDRWAYNDGWPTEWQLQINPTMPPGTDVSTWEGVVTNEDGCVTELHFSNNGMDGVIPSTIENLTHLTHLDLSGSRFVGAIPPEIGNLTNLSYLNISSNLLTGGIPPEIGNLTNLTFLKMQGYKIEGNIPSEIGNLTNLEELLLSHNDHTGIIPPEIGNLTNLRILKLAYNELVGNFPLEITNLTNLVELDITGNWDLGGNIPPEIENLTDLAYFSAGSTGLTGNIPPELGNMQSLRGLYLGSASFTGGIPPELSNLTNLKDLYIGGSVTGSIPPEIGDMSNLKNLNITGSVNGSIPPEIGNMTNLEHLYLSADFTGSIPPELGNLGNLSVLCLQNNNLTGTIPGELGNLNSLQYLYLHDNQLSGCYDINLLSLCSQLYQLGTNQSSNQFISDGNNFDTPWEDFCALTLGTCDCADSDYMHLRTMYLNSDGDNWTDNTGWLTADEFRANPIMPTGTDLSTWYGVMTNDEGCVTELRLSNNQLSGSIHTPLEYVENLTHLHLDDNQLTGNIPLQLANLENLTSLHLSGNQLSGSIPMEIQNFPSLTDLQISNNQFSGCYDTNLMSLCTKLDAATDATISDGNNFDTNWEDFCTGQTEACIDCREQDYMGLRALYLSSNGDDWWGYDDWLTAEEFLANPTMPADTDVSTWSGVTTNDYGCVTGIYVKRSYAAGTIPPEISYLTNLRTLSLIDLRLIDSIPPEILDLKNLEVLDLSRNNLTGNIPVELTELSNLKQLNLSSNNFAGNFPIEYTEFPHLEVLNLAGIPFGGNILPEIKNLTNLKELILRANEFTGEIPLEITELLNLKALDLGYNSLTGNIPSEIGYLTDLNKLRLDRNDLTGSIPAELGNLTKLTYSNFDIGYNQLSGCYDINLMPLCQRIGYQNLPVSQGNDFSNTWYNFCILEEGIDMPVNLKVVLEGVYDPALNEMTTKLNTERGLLPGQTPANSLVAPTPVGQPYNAAPWNYIGTEGADWTDDSYTNDAVDWVLISLRSDITKESEKARAAGILNKDGTITMPDRCNLSVNSDSVYIVIEHRNHMGIMSPQPVPIDNYTLTYDFTRSNSYDGNATGAGQKELSSGVWGMYVGDADQASDANSYDINGSDKTPWVEDNGTFDSYAPTDFNMDGDVIGADKTIWFENYGTSSRVPK